MEIFRASKMYVRARYLAFHLKLKRKKEPKGKAAGNEFFLDEEFDKRSRDAIDANDIVE